MCVDSTFRANVGAVIADGAGRVLIFERADRSGGWQFPQGGIDDGEEPQDAVLREITEETGIDPVHLTHLATHPQWLGYEIPLAHRGPKTGRGQVQKWFLFRLDDDALVQPPQGEDMEFSGYRWVAIDEAVECVVDFKRPVYEAVAEVFGGLLSGG
jgi:putative (di)nucleoside polyphosphate hydrolase